eukprot:scpid61025/ scgid12131/ 
MKPYRTWNLPGSNSVVAVFVPSYLQVGFDLGIRVQAHGRLWKDSFNRKPGWGCFGPTIEWVFEGHHFMLVLDNSNAVKSPSRLYLFVDGWELEEGELWNAVWQRICIHRIVFALFCFLLAVVLVLMAMQHLPRFYELAAFPFALGAYHILFGFIGVVRTYTPRRRGYSALPSTGLPTFDDCPGEIHEMQSEIDLGVGLTTSTNQQMEDAHISTDESSGANTCTGSSSVHDCDNVVGTSVCSELLADNDFQRDPCLVTMVADTSTTPIADCPSAAACAPADSRESQGISLDVVSSLSSDDFGTNPHCAALSTMAGDVSDCVTLVTSTSADERPPCNLSYIMNAPLVEVCDADSAVAREAPPTLMHIYGSESESSAVEDLV